MNIAILMAQSDYLNTGKLNACKNDLQAMVAVVNKSKKYDDVLILDDSTSRAYEANEKIIQFVNKYKETDSIDEVLFYFSGHGNFIDNEFYYIWDDYEESKKRQTCLVNSDIDSFLKKLNAKLTVKIVDACQSGVPYLKGGDEFKKFLTSSKDVFQKCYFLFSSQNDEYSEADYQISFFTKSILDSIKSLVEKKSIRYKDIMNYVSDEFEISKVQTPLFITQCDYTETFIEMNSEIRNYLSTELYKDSKNDAIVEATSANSISILDLVKKDAQKYVSFEEAIECLEKLKNKAASMTLNSELADIYSLELNDIANYDDIPQIKEIAKWIQSNSIDTYTQLHFETVDYAVEVPKSSWEVLFDQSKNSYKTVKKQKKEIRSYSNTLKLPYKGLNILFKGLFPNIMNSSLCIVPILSRIKLFLFVSKVGYKRFGWDQQNMDNFSAKWEIWEIPYESSSIDEFVSNTFNKAEQYVVDELKKAFPVSKD